MSSSRRLLYQGMLVVALGAVSALRARPAAAAQAPATMCDSQLSCTTDCGEVWTSIECIDCGGDAYPYCESDIWDCGAGGFAYGCAFAS